MERALSEYFGKALFRLYHQGIMSVRLRSANSAFTTLPIFGNIKIVNQLTPQLLNHLTKSVIHFKRFGLTYLDCNGLRHCELNPTCRAKIELLFPKCIRPEPQLLDLRMNLSEEMVTQKVSLYSKSHTALVLLLHFACLAVQI